ncbi:hypothetical protein K461DRAFT_312343 [Myriangium duriaei CBS 260.36]|uniref:GLEYA adhesin domain-containing protein n=1 Tax=Myriangium duriaei CBS 260.36 TaxID=1168546 RepID=A0A9P4J447_9PEZI|nr:hypothetical protein K461DRAFT_312343 [Myriangium duriaei CBS 260.36]
MRLILQSKFEMRHLQLRERRRILTTVTVTQPAVTITRRTVTITKTAVTVSASPVTVAKSMTVTVSAATVIKTAPASTVTVSTTISGYASTVVYTDVAVSTKTVDIPISGSNITEIRTSYVTDMLVSTVTNDLISTVTSNIVSISTLISDIIKTSTVIDDVTVVRTNNIVSFSNLTSDITKVTTVTATKDVTVFETDDVTVVRTSDVTKISSATVTRDVTVVQTDDVTIIQTDYITVARTNNIVSISTVVSTAAAPFNPDAEPTGISWDWYNVSSLKSSWFSSTKQPWDYTLLNDLPINGSGILSTSMGVDYDDSSSTATVYGVVMPSDYIALMHYSRLKCGVSGIYTFSLSVVDDNWALWIGEVANLSQPEATVATVHCDKGSYIAFRWLYAQFGGFARFYPQIQDSYGNTLVSEQSVDPTRFDFMYTVD